MYSVGISDWNEIAKLVPERSARQCRERWIKYLSPMTRSDPFTQQEDELLRALHRQLGAKWVKISRHFPGRTDIQIKNRWLVLMRHDRKQNQSELKEHLSGDNDFVNDIEQNRPKITQIIDQRHMICNIIDDDLSDNVIDIWPKSDDYNLE